MNQRRTELDRGERVIVKSGRYTVNPSGDERDDEMRDADRVRWGPVAAGLVAALATLVMLGFLGLSVGLANVDPNATSEVTANDAARNSGLWSAVAGVLAFLVGGYVAGRTSGTRDRSWTALNGAFVFLLAVPLILWLAAQGAGSVLGALGNGIDANRLADGASMDAAARAAARDAARNAATAALIGSLLGLVSSAIGGWFGGRDPETEHDEERSRDGHPRVSRERVGAQYR
jgi:hypothetical protein